MLGFLTRIFSKTVVNNSNIYNSSVTTIFWYTNPKFKVKENWLKSVLSKHFSGEMEAKFIPELHQSHEFERRHLQDILNFKSSLENGLRQIHQSTEALASFKKQYQFLLAIKNSEQLTYAKPEHDVLIRARELNNFLPTLHKALNQKEKLFRLSGYKILDQRHALSQVMQPIPDSFNERVSLMDVFEKKAPSDHFIIRELISAYNQVYRAINALNLWLERYEQHRNHKIIHGVAGTGKTHTTAYLVQQLTSNGDFVIFLNAKSFNGDGVDFEERLHQLLDIPHGLRLGLTLKLLNKFARKRGRRIFIILDALNETTKENLGFSDIWNQQLQALINAMRSYTHLYFVCTLRTSYLSSIWEARPAGAVELTDINRYEDVLSMCQKYFSYYRIEATNLDKADLQYFSVPLLLDLYCKLINEDREHSIAISLDINSYMQVFEGYIDRLTREVQMKRQLATKQLIESGLRECSDRFMNNIGGTLTVDEFVLSFDQPDTRLHDSIAQPMLEGYLLFIRDKITVIHEIVKHTQQQIGGYLLAIRLVERYPELTDLVASKEFSEMLNGANSALHHQLRLDIVQFLICLKPNLVNFITEVQAFEAGWWYLFNMHGEAEEIAESLIQNPLSLRILPFIMRAGSRRLFDTGHSYNFSYIFLLLERYSSWDFDLNWTYYLYVHADELYQLINEYIDRLKANATDSESEALVALYIALINATTVRTLRDLATMYLLEFGKRYPIELLNIAKRTVALNDVYVYERVVQSLYGVILTRQHDLDFRANVLPILANEVFELQFSTNATSPLYNYVVIDSVKHILDFAQIMGVWTASETDLENIRRYRVPALQEWSEPSESHLQSVQERDERNPPKPIGMDFAIYTIPRLIDNEKYEMRTIAVANVLKRVYELGFQAEMIFPEYDDQLKAFAFGHNVSFPSKVDRIGKKYNWKGFYDYAGFLLQHEQLDVYNQPNNPQSGYHRLSDVGIDISNPNRDFEVAERVYLPDLIDSPATPEKWTNEIKIETIEQYFVREFKGVRYFMLNGLVEQNVDESYESRSFIMTETCLIDRNDDFEELKNTVCKKVFDWERDIHMSPAYNTNTYFGEYYFADNQVPNDGDTYSIKTGETVRKPHRVRPHDVLDGSFKAEEINQIREKTFPRFLHFDGEATLIQYLNESDSEIFKGLSRYIPTIKMGKFLKLKADPSSGLILDSELSQAVITVNFTKGDFKNEFVYIRADLLESYAEAHNYALLYQSKQHSYAKNVGNNRSMKYAVIEPSVRFDPHWLKFVVLA